MVDGQVDLGGREGGREGKREGEREKEGGRVCVLLMVIRKGERERDRDR